MLVNVAELLCEVETAWLGDCVAEGICVELCSCVSDRVLDAVCVQLTEGVSDNEKELLHELVELSEAVLAAFTSSSLSEISTSSASVAAASRK